MFCETCLKIPLDLFLPMDAKASRFKDGKAWNFAYLYREGESAVDELAASAADGCQLCTLFHAALERAEPLWAIKQFTGRGHNMLLHPPRHTEEVDQVTGITFRCHLEGELIITDGRRTAGMYWELPSLGYGKPTNAVNDRADDFKNISMTDQWLKTCTAEHKTCNTSPSINFLPRRLIFVARDPSGGMRAYLVDTAKSRMDPAHTKFAALSHCWGPSAKNLVPKATKATLAQYETEIKLSSMPQTFKEAIGVCYSLGCSYLWIDSMCIVQDDPSEFDVECSKMHQIYSGAHFTIAASGSTDPDGGCFIPRSPNDVQPATIKLTNLRIPYQRTSIMDIIWGRFKDDPDDGEIVIFPNFGPWIKAVQQGPVFQRGWCLQERELSNRVVHYTKERLLWECRECIASEDEPEMKPKDSFRDLALHLSPYRLLDNTSLTTLASAKSGVKQSVGKWDMVAKDYSERKLSVPEDKLPAISGLAAIMGNWLNDDYLAGIWRNDLLKGLCWFPSRGGEHAPVPYSAWPPSPVDKDLPSWTWASYDGAIEFYGNSWFAGAWTTILDHEGKEKWVKGGPQVSIESASTTPVGVNKYGRVSGGQVTLFGWVVELNICEDDQMGNLGDNPAPGAKAKTGPRNKCYRPEEIINGMMIYFDYDVEDLPQTQVVCLQMGTGQSVWGANKCETGLVLLKNTDSPRETYRRVGMFDVVDSVKDRWSGLRQKRTVTIV